MSKFAIIDESVPVEYEKYITPISIRKIQKTFSAKFIAKMSPYPTVRMVITVKYQEVMYSSMTDKSL